MAYPIQDRGKKKRYNPRRKKTVSEASNGPKMKDPIKKTETPGKPTGAGLAAKIYTKADKLGDAAKGVATVAKGMHTYGRGSKALQAAMSGLAGGLQISSSMSRGKDATTTVSKSAAAQKGKWNATNKGKTKKP